MGITQIWLARQLLYSEVVEFHFWFKNCKLGREKQQYCHCFQQGNIFSICLFYVRFILFLFLTNVKSYDEAII